MKADTSRHPKLDPKDAYTRVLKEQGRLNTDADWNAHAEITLRRVREEAKDVIGPCGVPLSEDGGDGFKISAVTGSELKVTKGAIYVDGLLCELTESVSLDVTPTPTPTVDTDYKLFLDVWERSVSQIDDPDLVDDAIGVPTSGRIRTMWTLLPVTTGGPPPVRPGSAKLKTGEASTDASTDPCTPVAGGGYVGLENRLYRVEIQTGGTAGAATFKWSRDNGSVVYPVEKCDSDEVTLTVRHLGKDDRTALHEGDIVEFVDDSDLASGRPGILGRVVAGGLDRAALSVKLSVAISGFNKDLHPRLIRWDHGHASLQPDLAIKIDVGTEIDLEDGVQVTFGSSGTYIPGDYWVFMARASTRSVEKLSETDPFDAPPHGVKHHYCLLATANFDGTNWNDLIDKRKTFPPLTELPITTPDIGDGDDDGVKSVDPGGPPFVTLPPVELQPGPPEGMKIVPLGTSAREAGTFAAGITVTFDEGISAVAKSLNRFTFDVILLLAENGEEYSDMRTDSFSGFHALGEIKLLDNGNSARFEPSLMTITRLNNSHYYCGVPQPVDPIEPSDEAEVSPYRYVPCHVVVRSRQILNQNAPVPPAPIGSVAHEAWFLIEFGDVPSITLSVTPDPATVSADGGNSYFGVTVTKTSGQPTVTLTRLFVDGDEVPGFFPADTTVSLDQPYTKDYLAGIPESTSGQTSHEKGFRVEAADTFGRRLEASATATVTYEAAPAPVEDNRERVYLIACRTHPVFSAEGYHQEIEDLYDAFAMAMNAVSLAEGMPDYRFELPPLPDPQADWWPSAVAHLKLVLGSNESPWSLWYPGGDEETDPLADQIKYLAQQAEALLLAAGQEGIAITPNTCTHEVLLQILAGGACDGLAIVTSSTLTRNGLGSIEDLLTSIPAGLYPLARML